MQQLIVDHGQDNEADHNSHSQSNDRRFRICRSCPDLAQDTHHRRTLSSRRRRDQCCEGIAETAAVLSPGAELSRAADVERLYAELLPEIVRIA